MLSKCTPVIFVILLIIIAKPFDLLAGLNISVSVDSEILSEPVDGRLLLLLSTDGSKEPRFQISDDHNTQQVFGIDIENMNAGDLTTFNDNAFGYPIRKLSQMPKGKYRVQAVLHVYETFRRADGHVVKLPPDRGEGQKWNKAPGNLYSSVKTVDLAQNDQAQTVISLDHIIPAIEPPVDTKYVKHIRIQSKLLTEFWGKPMYLGAHVLLPHGFEAHPEAKYPLVVFHGHFSPDLSTLSETPPDPDLVPEYSERFRMEGYNRIEQEYMYQAFLDWKSENFPRMIVIEIQHANPYYDDSYAVNSANLGPYGDAITYELIPYIEKEFRGIGAGWARFLYGGSTGGWEALAAQVFYPDEYNGCYAACPDPIDFRAYTIVDIYQDKNAYYSGDQFKKTPRPGKRDYLGRIEATLEEMNHKELALGTRSRSGDQWDIWQAVYSPAGPDGYPLPIWDKLSGAIDQKVAEYWQKNYDLRYILERDWAVLGPKLSGKIHIYCGDMDNYYLNNAVYLMEEFLQNTKDPHYAGEIDYGDRAEHCWNGDHTKPNAISRLRYSQMFLPKIVERIRISAPAGADTISWKY